MKCQHRHTERHNISRVKEKNVAPVNSDTRETVMQQGKQACGGSSWPVIVVITTLTEVIYQQKKSQKASYDGFQNEQTGFSENDMFVVQCFVIDEEFSRILWSLGTGKGCGQEQHVISRAFYAMKKVYFSEF